MPVERQGRLQQIEDRIAKTRPNEAHNRGQIYLSEAIEAAGRFASGTGGRRFVVLMLERAGTEFRQAEMYHLHRATRKPTKRGRQAVIDQEQATVCAEFAGRFVDPRLTSGDDAWRVREELRVRTGYPRGTDVKEVLNYKAAQRRSAIEEERLFRERTQMVGIGASYGYGQPSG